MRKNGVDHENFFPYEHDGITYQIPRELELDDGKYRLEENGAIIHYDALIGDNVCLDGGRTIIKARVKISGSEALGTYIGKHCFIEEDTVLDDCEVGNKVKIGKRVDISESKLLSLVTVEDDVEIYNREIGREAKILEGVHLEFGRRIIRGEIVTDSI